MDIIRVTGHPNDPHIVLLHVPHHCNDLMGRYEPAQLDTDLKAYLLHVDMLESFDRFIAYTGMYVVDERGQTPTQLGRADMCDICMKPAGVCLAAAGNSGGLHDHQFVSIREADARRAAAKTPTTAKEA